MQKGSHLIKLHGLDHAWLSLLLHLILMSPLVAGQPAVTPAMEPDNKKSVITIMAIVIVMFLISAFLSLYSRKCTDRQPLTNGGNRLDPAAAPTVLSQGESNGLNQATIDTFPRFLYSEVKGLKIGKDTLVCAVCLNEFEEHETLRMIPKCCHVYHPNCIDIWLASHTTCPVCRANLVPQLEDANININMPPMLSIQIPDEEEEQEHEHQSDSFEDRKRDSDVDVLRRIRSLHQSRPSRSRSTGFLSSLLFPRSNSTSQLVQPCENYERFTLRLPEEVRSQMVNSTTKLKRANSCVCFTRMNSGTWGYRTRSVGSGRGRGYIQYERFSGAEEPWGWIRSTRKSPIPRSNAELDNNTGERSSEF